MNKKIRVFLTIAAALVLVVASIGGTVAYLTAETPAVTNEFTTAKVTLELKEHKLVNGALTTEEVTTNTYKMIPGATLPKDPFVRVGADSEDCWVFVEVCEVNNAATYIEYSVDTANWTLLTGKTGRNGGAVYYYNTALSAGNQKYILTNNKIVISSDIDADDMTAADANKPELVFYAYACQSANVTTATAAWEAISPTPVTP